MPDQAKELLQSGQIVLERYRVERGIAQGGHSLVFLGTDTRLRRPVCIKAFYKLGTQKGIWDTAYDHFVQEAFALSKLSHPNTLRIYDFGHLEGRSVRSESGIHKAPVQVSEYMDGGTLGSLLVERGPLPEAQALGILRKLGHALAEAHRLGIVHRDIKPQNILFTSKGDDREPKLADFGIAKSISAELENQAESTEVVVGFPLAMYSPSWAAPEQLDGAPASPPADVFSLALLGIYALTGRALCKCDSPKDAHRLRERASKTAGQLLLDVGVAPPIIRLLQACCSYDASDRPQDSEEFSEALAAAMLQRSAPLPVADISAAPPMPKAAPAQSPPKGPPPIPNKPASSERAANATRLSPSTSPQMLGSHTLQFVEMHAPTTLHWGETRAQFRITPSPGTRSRFTLTVKGLTTFVARSGGRPSRAVHLSEDGYVELLTPSKAPVGRLYIALGIPDGGQQQFAIGNEVLSLDTTECPHAVVVDCPGLNYSYILYGSASASRSVSEHRHSS